jgi:hypothetical protein
MVAVASVRRRASRSALIGERANVAAFANRGSMRDHSISLGSLVMRCLFIPATEAQSLTSFGR